MFKKKVKMEQGNKIKNKALNGFILIIVFIILFLQIASADLYLNSKVGTIYFNTTGVARASIGPGGNFSINTSDFFVNQKNLEFGFIKNKLVFECAQESGDSRHLDDRRADLMRHDRHTNLGRVGIGTVMPTQNILNFIGDMNG